jgi:predicted dehydrogenase
MTTTRREFLKTSAAAMASGPLILTRGSPGEKLVVAVVGMNSRGIVHIQNFGQRMKNCEVAYLCDVDTAALAKGQKVFGADERVPKSINDFRRALDDKSVDVVSIATPDHWHTPMAMLALAAGKHVYLEKPTGHNPREGELIVAAQKKHNRLVQLGTQQRSSPRTIEALQVIKDGAIGAPYLTRAWYANTRVGIGKGKTAPVPSNIDYELWQGPAPRTPYHDNYIHYNWHWFRRWGTGEINNNGTHEIDVARLTLGVDFPTRVESNGGRFHYKDDWEFPDTQDATFEFADGKRIVWHGESCNGQTFFNRGRGTVTYGTQGSLVLDRDGYVLYDLKGKVVRENLEPKKAGGTADLVGDDAATLWHMENLAEGIRTGAALRAPISDGAKSNLLCHLGNIAWYTGRILKTNPKDGHIIGDAEAMKYWSRSYAPGWAPTIG